MYNTHPYFWTALKKKNKAENRGCRFAKLTLKSCYHLQSTASSSSIILGTLRVTEVRPIFEELGLSWSFLLLVANAAVTFQSGDLQRCHKQARFHISPSHRVAHAKLQIHVILSSEFSAFQCLTDHPKGNA